MFYIYRLQTCLHGTYIGMSKDMKTRIYQHEISLANGNHGSKLLQEDYDKAARLNMKFFTVDTVAKHKDKFMAELLEQLFIYKVIVDGQKSYNTLKEYFPLNQVLECTDDYVLGFVDDDSILYAYANGEFNIMYLRILSEKLHRPKLRKMVNPADATESGTRYMLGDGLLRAMKRQRISVEKAAERMGWRVSRLADRLADENLKTWEFDKIRDTIGASVDIVFTLPDGTKI